MSTIAVRLALLALAATTGCSDITPPEPARTRTAIDDRIKPGTRTRLKGGFIPGRRYETFKVSNMERFAWNVLDDIELSVTLPAGSLPPGRVRMSDHHVRLRCPSPKVIPAGAEIEIAFDACVSTTDKPEPGALASALRLVAREGYLESHTEPPLEFGRPPK